MDSAAGARPVDDEERRRRSTDCIYFLASPLTCIKGSQCEFRHSDAARMNPRNCWYWFNGNCTNPKCSFRHPPLDNLLGAPVTPRAAQQSAPQAPVPSQAHGSFIAPFSGTGTAKQSDPCYYFQKGMCAKGDKCAFLHVPQVARNSASEPMQKVFASASKPNPQLKNSWTKPNSLAQQNTASGILDKSKASAHDGKPAQKQNLTRRVDNSSRIYQKHNNSHAQSSSAKYYQPQRSIQDKTAENGDEVGEFVREPSAGSSVLRGNVNYNPEESFKGTHNSYDRTNGKQQTGMRQTHGRHEPESPYRSPGETLLSDKRISQKEPINVTAGTSDLRHRLLKQRRLSNPISSQASDRHDAYLEDRHATRDGLKQSRLHGRIKLPGETPFDRLGSGSEREKDRGPKAISLPLKHTDVRGRLHERLKARCNDDIPDNAKSLVKRASIGDDAGSLNFAGPKSLAELKAKKVPGSSGGDAVSSTASFVVLEHRTSETVGSRDSSERSVPFEGLKPLSVELKRKREATPADSGSIQEEEDIAGAEGESQDKIQILESGPQANGDEDEDAFHPEDDMAYDDSFHGNAVEDAGKELEEPQDQDYDYNADAADLNADEDNDYQEYEEDDDDLEDDDDFARKVGVIIS